MEASVRSFWTSFTGKHAGGVFSLALERIDAGREREVSRKVLLKTPPKQICPAFEARDTHFWDVLVTQALCGCGDANLLSPDFKNVVFCLVTTGFVWPALQPVQVFLDPSLGRGKPRAQPALRRLLGR